MVRVQHALASAKICYFRTPVCFEVFAMYLFHCMLPVLFFIFLTSVYGFSDITGLS
jgi:hypothetical protein